MTITARHGRSVPVRASTVVVGLVALVAGVLIGAGGSRHDDAVEPQHHVGSGYVGVGLASLSPDGHDFVSVDSHTPWYDGDGTLHEGAFPSCLPQTTSVHGIHWSDVAVAMRSGAERVVAFVDCGHSG